MTGRPTNPKSLLFHEGLSRPPAVGYLRKDKISKGTLCNRHRMVCYPFCTPGIIDLPVFCVRPLSVYIFILILRLLTLLQVVDIVNL